MTYASLQEVRDDPIARVKLNSERLLWEELSPVEVDTHKLEHLFESRAKDFITKVNSRIIIFYLLNN